MIKLLRKLLGRDSGIVVEAKPMWNPQLFIYVKIPGDIQPLERGERFEDPLEAALQAANLGAVSGGGSQLDDPYPDGSPRVEFCGIDVDATDTDEARALLMAELLKLQAPSGSELHYTKGVSKLMDRLTHGVWEQALTRTETHPGFGA